MLMNLLHDADTECNLEFRGIPCKELSRISTFIGNNLQVIRLIFSPINKNGQKK